MYPIKRLLVICEKDPASVNIFSHLDGGEWDSEGEDGYARYKRRGNDMFMIIPEKHLYTDDVDICSADNGFKPDVVVFPSVHSSGSAMPALTVHPIGNFTDAAYGGRAEKVVRAAP